MKSWRTRILALVGITLVVAVGLAALLAPVALAACKEPVACPAIAKVCPQGQIACRVSPCNCTLACAVPGHGCNDGSEPW